jgi:hypothetical protein
MDNLGIEKVSSQEQYIIYIVSYSKINACMRNRVRISFPTLEMANNVIKTLSYFIHNWDCGYHGGEVLFQPNRGLFTKINDNLLMNSQGDTINISNFVERSKELMKYKYKYNLWALGTHKGFYDEYTLAVLRNLDFLPRIKRTSFTFNPFSYNYIETDEKTVREMGLVITKLE